MEKHQQSNVTDIERYIFFDSLSLIQYLGTVIDPNPAYFDCVCTFLDLPSLQACCDTQRFQGRC